MSDSTIEPAPPPTPPAPGADHRSLDRSLVQGIAWTGALKWVAQGLSWVSYVVVARLLTPADFGLVGMATLFLGFIQLVNEFGLGAAIVQWRDLEEDQVASLGGVSITLGFFWCGFSCAVAHPITLFYGEPAVQWIVVALSATFVTTAFKVLPRSLLLRDLRFRNVAALDTVESLLGMATTLVLALLGFRYWSLVLGTIGSSLGATIVALAWRRHRLAWPRDFARIRHAMTFGGHQVLARVSWYVYSNADFAIVGRVLGKGPLGTYTLGWTLASIPVDRISALLGQVTPAVFSAVQDDRPALRRYLLRITEGLSYITLPMAAGLALVADELVAVVLGPAWLPAVAPLRLLALYGGFRSLTPILSQMLFAIRRSKTAMYMNLLALAVLPPLFFAGTHWGAAGVAAAWIVGYPFVTVPLYAVVLRALDVRLSDYAGALWPAVSATLLLAAAVLGVRNALPPATPPLVRLLTDVAAGVAVYGLALLVLHRSRVREIASFLRGMRSK